MSAVSKDYAALAASTSTLLESSMMEGDELYDPTTVPIANEEWSKKGGTSNLCRLCANTSDYFIPIFEGEGLEHELSEKIDKHLPIKVCDSDSLPIHVCYQCASTLIAWHDLLLNCVEAEKKLLQIQQQVEQDDLEESKNIEFDAAPSMDSDNAEDSVEATTPLVTPEEMEKSAPSTSKKNTSIKERPSLKRPLAKKSASSQKKARKTETEISPVGPEDGPAEEETVIGRLEEKQMHEKYMFESFKNLEEYGDVRFIVETIYPDTSSSQQEFDETISTIKEESSTAENIKFTPNVCDVAQPDFTQQYSLFHACDKCGKIFLTEKLLKVHLKIHLQEPVKCNLCGRVYKNERVLDTHMSLHKEAKPWPCNYCDKVFIFDSSLQEHIKSDHEPDNSNKTTPNVYTCQICEIKFDKLEELKSHLMSTHKHLTKRHICEFCGAMYHTSNKLKTHLLKHTGEFPFTCEVCGMRFCAKYRLNNHLVCHVDERPHICSVCGWAFKRLRNLRAHEQDSHGIVSQGPGNKKSVANFSCQMCEWQFTSKKRLDSHMSVHTGLKPFPCEICGSAYATPSKLSFHKKTMHSGLTFRKKTLGPKKPFLCSTCGKVLTSNLGLELHMRTHTGERPYECKVCKMAIKTPSQLHGHMQTHSDIRPYTCSICNKSFRRRPYLLSHLRTHTGEKPHPCSVCGRAFLLKTDMKKHKKTVHKIPETDEKTAVTSSIVKG